MWMEKRGAIAEYGSTLSIYIKKLKHKLIEIERRLTCKGNLLG